MHSGRGQPPASGPGFPVPSASPGFPLGGVRLNSPLPDRHARPKRGIQRQRDVSPLTPRRQFCQQRIKAPVRVRKPSMVEACFSMRPFPLRQRELAFRPVPASRVAVPGLHLRNDHRDLFPVRSVSHSCPRPAFFLASRDRSLRETRYQVRPQDSPSVFKPPLASGTFDPSGS